MNEVETHEMKRECASFIPDTVHQMKSVKRGMHHPYCYGCKILTLFAAVAVNFSVGCGASVPHEMVSV